MGRRNSKTTEIYTHVSTKRLGKIRGPLIGSQSIISVAGISNVIHVSAEIIKQQLEKI